MKKQFSTKDISTLQVLRAVRDRKNFIGMDGSPPYIDELLSAQTKIPMKVCYRALEREENRGHIESGVSLGLGWLTDKGKAELERLEGE